MNAPVANAAAALDPIATLRSWEPESKLALRRKLNSIALRADARAQRATSPDAGQEFRRISLLAFQWTLATADEAALDDIRGALIRMALAADSLERNGSGL